MFLDKVLDFLFPPICGICLKKNNNWICNECYDKLNINLKRFKINNKINGNIDKKTKEKVDEKLEEKRSKKYYINNVYYLFEYKDIARKKILDYKFNDQSYLAKMFSNIILKNEKICKLLKSYDIIIPVPMYIKKKRCRGYNQTELIVNDIAKNLEIESNNDILLKVRENKMQSSLDYLSRKENVKNVYEINFIEKIKINDRKILLFDDIYTTGFTIKECIRELEKLNPKKIDVLVLAKGKIEKKIER